MLPKPYFPHDFSFKYLENMKYKLPVIAFWKFPATFPGLINEGPSAIMSCLEERRKLLSLVVVAGKESQLLLAK